MTVGVSQIEFSVPSCTNRSSIVSARASSKRAPRARLPSISATRFWGYFAGGRLEQAQRIVEPIELPKGACLAQFRQVGTQAGYDRRFRGAEPSRRSGRPQWVLLSFYFILAENVEVDTLALHDALPI